MLSKLKSYRSRRASTRPFLTMSSFNMTGAKLIAFIQDADEQFSKHLDGVQPEIADLYKQIITLVEKIAASNGKKHIPAEFASRIRSLLCYYFTDVNDFHLKGLSGSGNSGLKVSYEAIVDRLTEIQKEMALKGHAH